MILLKKIKAKISDFSLLFKFATAAAIVLTTSAFLLGLWLSSVVQRELTSAFAQNTADYVKASVEPLINKTLTNKASLSNLRTELADYFSNRKIGFDIVSVKIWARDGTVVYAREKYLVGEKFPVEQGLSEALDGRLSFHITDLDKAENVAEKQRYDRLLEIYSPIFLNNGSIAGAFEIYQDLKPLKARLDRVNRSLWIGISTSFLFLLLSLSGIVQGAGRTISAQKTQLQASYSKLKETYAEIVNSLNTALETKDYYTRGHSKRVTEISYAIGKHMSLSINQLQALQLAGTFHDIGKIAVPEGILNKKGKLDEEEFEQIKKHPQASYSILKHLDFLSDSLDIVLYHHERWDGSGYPEGLKGEEIPLLARILAVADTYDALTSKRSYRDALSPEDALLIIKKVSGSQLCPTCVKAFLEIYETGNVLMPKPYLKHPALQV